MLGRQVEGFPGLANVEGHGSIITASLILFPVQVEIWTKSLPAAHILNLVANWYLEVLSSQFLPAN